MIYLVFAVLFLSGGAVAFILFRGSRIYVDAVVLESREIVVTKDSEITRLTVQHALERPGEPGKVIITDSLPIHEPDGARVKLLLDRKTMEPVKDRGHFLLVLPVVMMASGLFCGYLAALDYRLIPQLPLKISVGETVILAALVLLAFHLLSAVFALFNPNVVKVRGRYAGYLHSEAEHSLTGYYSLWYGQHRQYAKSRIPLLPVNDREYTLYYNTRRGTAIKRADILLNVCFGILILAGAVALYLCSPWGGFGPGY